MEATTIWGAVGVVGSISTVVLGTTWRLSERLAQHHARVTADVERVAEDLRAHTTEEERITTGIGASLRQLNDQSGETSRRVAHLLTVSGINPRDVP
jgi:hypothetical protein